MLEVENLISERWDTQMSASAIRQQSSLLKVATWAEFRDETEQKLESAIQVPDIVISVHGFML